LEVYFQNQHDRPSLGRIALRPAKGFWLTRANIGALIFDIPCDAAAFGLARVPIPLPRDVQGKKQSFEVGASIEYPHGKGRRLRFRDGISMHTNTRFKNAFGTILTVAGALTGQIVFMTPETAIIRFPTNAVEEFYREAQLEIRTLWKLGDPPLNGQVWNSIQNKEGQNYHRYGG
jgi:hypothetical protein